VTADEIAARAWYGESGRPAGDEAGGPITAVIAEIERAGVAPIDSWHLAALLEAEGWGDARAREAGHEDIFDLARTVYPHLPHRAWRVGELARPQAPLIIRLVTSVLNFIRGLVFALPLLVASGSSLLVGLSLYSFAGFGVREATGIGLGTMASFMATGGVTQAVSRRGLFFMSLKEYGLARRTALQMLLAGMVLALALGMVIFVFFTFIPMLSSTTLRYLLLYYPFLSLAWLCISLLYMLQREIIFTGVITIAILMVIGIVKAPSMQAHPPEAVIVFAHLLALSFVAVSSALIGMYYFRVLEKRAGIEDAGVQPARWSVAVSALFPFFVYGILFSAMLFTDRFMAWTTPSMFHPQVVWFVGPYELGLNWAYLSLVIPMGCVELGVRSLIDRLQREQALYPYSEVRQFNRRLANHWARAQIAILVVGLMSAALVALVLQYAHSWGVEDSPYDIPIATWVFLWGLGGNVLLVAGLSNLLLLFCVNQPWPAVRALAVALGTDIVVSFLASRLWSRCFDPDGCAQAESLLRYPQAVLGFVAGALVLWIVAGWFARQVIDRADFILYEYA
jgi:hypothetical protein